MELGIFTLSSLIFYIGRDSGFRSCPSDGIDEIPAGPECPSPQLFLHFRVVFEDFSRGDALDDLNDVFRQEHGDGLDEKVDMVFISADFEKMDIISFGYFQAGMLDRLVYLFREYNPTILRRTDDVIEHTVDVVALVQVEAHAYRIPLRSKLRGIYPKRE